MNKQGFTLIETLTAMMILSIAVVAVLQLFSGGLKSSRLSEEYTRAIFHAKEKIAEILLENQLFTQERAGEFKDGFRWRAVILYLDPEASEEENKRLTEKQPLDLFHITVSVIWDSGTRERHFDIITMHIAEKMENPDGS